MIEGTIWLVPTTQNPNYARWLDICEMKIKVKKVSFLVSAEKQEVKGQRAAVKFWRSKYFCVLDIYHIIGYVFFRFLRMK